MPIRRRRRQVRITCRKEICSYRRKYAPSRLHCPSAAPVCPHHGEGVAALIGERLDAVLREAGMRGASRAEALRAIAAWAAGQSYAAEGYAQARALVLDALEAVLILDSVKKSAA